MAEVFLTGRCGWKHVFPISEKLCQEMGWYRVGADETESSGGKLTSLVLGPFDMSTVHSPSAGNIKFYWSNPAPFTDIRENINWPEIILAS